MWGAVSDERTGLSFTIANDHRQRSHSRVRVPWDSWPYFTATDSRLPFGRLLGLAGLRWKYWTPPPHGINLELIACPLSNFGANRIEFITPENSSVILGLSVAVKTCVNFVATLWFLQTYPLPRILVLGSRYLAMDVSAVLLWLNISGVQDSCHNMNLRPDIFDTLGCDTV
jgi:hypothetical protein